MRFPWRGTIALLAIFGSAALGTESAAAQAPTPSPPANVPTTAQRTQHRTAERAAALDVAQEPEVGTYVTDGQGRALYMFTKDLPGQSECEGKCAMTWQPVIAAQGKPNAQASSIDSDDIGTTKRDDGTMQVTYLSHPLYYFSEDQGKEHSTAGEDAQGYGGTFYLISPKGNKLVKMRTGQGQH